MTPDDQRVRDIRQALADPVALCRALGLHEKATRQSSGLTILCPAHGDRKPSCSVTRAQDGTVRVRCFACDFSGDALTLVAQVHGLDIKRDFRGVLAVAATIAGLHGIRDEVERPREPASLDDSTFHALASELVERCPFDAENDVLAYLDRRALIVTGARARLLALPAPHRQGGLLADLARKFGAETVARADLAWRDDNGKPKLDRFAWPAHRLGIPWRNADGSVATLQRRRIDARKERRYVFAKGRPPRMPFGIEAMAGAGPDTKIAFAEGALDVLALRLLVSRDRLDIVPLGVPGVENWRTDWARLASGRQAIIALDADEAGESKRGAMVRDLYAAGAVDVERWRPDGAHDWCELVERGAA